MDEIILPQRCELASDCFFKLEEWVQLCALEAIDAAMSAKNAGWYGGFKEQEENEDDPIVEELKDRKFETIYKLDFQAAIKMLRFRAKKLNPVFKAYHLDKNHNSDFQKLLKRLNETRNEISGHLDADSIRSKYATMDSEEALRFLFRFREGILDFILFLSYFPEMRNTDGETYLEKARTEWNITEKLLHVYQYQVETAIEKENLGITVTQFAELCKTLHIIYRSDSEGNSFFATDDYKRSIQAIRVLAAGLPKEKSETPPAAEPVAMPVQQKTQKQHTGVLIAAVAIVATLLLVIIVLLAQRGGGNTQMAPNTPIQVPVSDTTASSQNSDNKTQNQAEIVIPRIKGAAIVGGLQISLDQIPSVYLTFHYENDNSKAFSLGWVNSAEVVVETTTGQFSGKISGHTPKIEKGSSGSFSATFDQEFTGTIKAITVKNILPLSDRGLPENASTEGLSLKINVTYS